MGKTLFNSPLQRETEKASLRKGRKILQSKIRWVEKI